MKHSLTDLVFSLKDDNSTRDTIPEVCVVGEIGRVDETDH